LRKGYLQTNIGACGGRRIMRSLTIALRCIFDGGQEKRKNPENLRAKCCTPWCSK